MRVGDRFGLWVVAGPVLRNGRGRQVVLCRCDCGVARHVTAQHLTSGRSTGCGCTRKAAMVKALTRHGRCGTPTYESWRGMVQRCTNPNFKDYHNYGGRGIKVCERWLKFENFFEDMGERPEGKTLDRHPNNGGNYEPGNCRWATPKEQRENRRPAKNAVLFEGKSMHYWAEQLGISYPAVIQRFHKYGTPFLLKGDSNGPKDCRTSEATARQS